MPRAKQAKLLKKPEIQAFFDGLAANIEPIAELNWTTELDLLIAVVLSAQCTDVAVNKATAPLWEVCREPQDYLDLGEEKLQEYIRSIGLFRAKAKNIIGLCALLLEKHDGIVPDNRDDLVQLPGVGRKTANVVLNVAFKQPTLPVDTHIFRVSNRVGMVRTKTPDKTEEAMLKKIPKEHLLDAHNLLILHGRYTCKARKPLCGKCPVFEVCNFPEKESLIS